MSLILLLLPIWESWGAPLGRWGPYAFPVIEGKKGLLYIVDGRRVWRFSVGRWEELYRLPEEVRTGIALGEDTLLLGGLGIMYLVSPAGTQELKAEGAGWIYRLWRVREYIGVRGVQTSFLGRLSGASFHISAVRGEWVGASTDKLFLSRGDTLLGFPEEKVLLSKVPTRWTEVSEISGKLWGLRFSGEAGPLLESVPQMRGGRQWVGPYLLTERFLWDPRANAILWESQEPIYTAAYTPSLIAILTSAECITLYLQAPIGWQRRWSLPVTQVRMQGSAWVAWQGETAVYPAGIQKYSATLIEPAFYRGEWLWATPKGIFHQNGQVFAAVGRYVGALAASQDKLAWASGLEVFVRKGEAEYSFRFSQPIRRLGWIGDTLWAWRGKTLYAWQGNRWESLSLSFQPEEAFCWGDSWYFRVGTRWLRFSKGKWDTLSQAPWLPARPLGYAWGRPLWSFSRGETTFIFTSLGLLALREKAGRLPPLYLAASIQSPALRKEGEQLILPSERPFIELTWRANSTFLPGLLRVYCQIGEEPPMRLTESKLILSLTQPGLVKLRLWIEHPWYEKSESILWEIKVTPPWYETWWARVGGVLVLLALGGGILYIREWNLRRIQRRLTEERAQLLAQTQRQQLQLLQAERMANLGVMAAHIAHEINTPLGVIRSALTESIDALSVQMGGIPLPREPRPSAGRLRELRREWQERHPQLAPIHVQHLAALGYVPEQLEEIASYLESEEKWSQLIHLVQLKQALVRAAEAADKLHARVQSIRTYVRGIEDSAPAPVNIADSLKATLDFYRPMMRKVEVELFFPSEPLYVCASPARLEQVWANLIQNAIQAMPDGGKLILRLERQADRAWIYIQDTGKGIPPHLREAIFEPLFTTKAPGEGTGLGLPLCRQIVESYGGQLRLLHSEPGYTLFGVELPLCKGE